MSVMDGLDTNLDDILAHHGVMGMKWGHRRAASGSDIKSARNRLMVKQDELRTARKAVRKAKEPHEKAMAKMELAQQEDGVPQEPRPRHCISADARREGCVPPAGPGLGAVGVGISSAASRRIEKKQDEGAYDKKK
jgi:hypothetical protein